MAVCTSALSSSHQSNAGASSLTSCLVTSRMALSRIAQADLVIGTGECSWHPHSTSRSTFSFVLQAFKYLLWGIAFTCMHKTRWYPCIKGRNGPQAQDIEPDLVGCLAMRSKRVREVNRFKKRPAERHTRETKLPIKA